MATENRVAHNITELRAAINTVTAVGSSTGVHEIYNITLDASETNNVLDFNNEDFYYFNNHIFTPASNITADNRWGYTMNIDLGGATLSNIYLYKDKALFNNPVGNQSSSSSAIDSNSYLVVKNATFEIVSNGSYISNIYEYRNGSGANVTFKNCIFNIRASDMSSHGLFRFGGKYHRFINCVFNIMVSGDLYSVFHSDPSLAGSYNIDFAMYSCEIRLLMVNNVPSKGIYYFLGTAYDCIDISDCIYFLDGLWTESSKIIRVVEVEKTAISPPIKKFSNNFIGALRDYNTKILSYYHNRYIEQGNYTFIDSDKFNVATSSSHNKFLTTAQCKDRDALIAEGYVFAAEM